MPSPKSYIPMLNGLMLGEAMSFHDGVRCYPAIRHTDQKKYIVKVISVPASQVQLDALLLTGAFPSREAALEYYMDISRDMLRETEILRQLSHQEGFIPYLDAQIISNDDFTGYEVYLLGSFRQSAEHIFESKALTHKQIMRMGLDLCAALAACRREGYLYVDLKPGNIFYSEDQGFQIGDVGFASLASLAYSSLPEKYRSRYTAPELLDEMAVINGTVDVYALGLVLYQAYNGGVLPESANGEPLPAPLYADYEFTDIIFKACHADPVKRFRDPMALAQAIIGYMQRNPVSDAPIIPEIPVELPEDPGEVEDFLPEADPEELDREIAALTGSEFEHLAFLTELEDSTLSVHTQEAQDADDLDLDGEISQMLAHADELIAHELPEPPVAPEPIPVPMPEPIVIEPEEPIVEPIPEEVIDPIVPEDTPDKAPAETEVIKVQPEPQKVPVTAEKPAAPRYRRPFPWRALAAILLVIAIFSAGFGVYYYYEHYFLQTVDELVVEQNAQMVTVKVISGIDNSLLTVVCSDSYGNTYRSSVSAGIAIFTELQPQTHYSIDIQISGFHWITGAVSDSFTTAAQTAISNLTAAAGRTDGSVVLQFESEGAAIDEWIVTYSAPGVTQQQKTFRENRVAISGLQIGKEYTFTLSTASGQNLTGTTQVQYVAKNLLLAQAATVLSCGNGKLTVQWTAPEGADQILWTVRCYNSAGFSQTVTTYEHTAVFTSLRHDLPCTVDITAEGMTKAVSIPVVANPVSVGDFHFTTSGDNVLNVSWDYYGTAPDGWELDYTVDGVPQETIQLSESRAELFLIPGGSYSIQVRAVNAEQQFGGSYSYSCPETESLTLWGISANALQAALCIRPQAEQWTIHDVSDSDFASHFAPGQETGLVIRSASEPQLGEDVIKVRLIFRDKNGDLRCIVEFMVAESQIWNDKGCTMNIPWMPEESGEYSVRVYFNGQFVTNLSFSITENP